jgi:uncharacterized protein YdcH (DUF465 family)
MADKKSVLSERITKLNSEHQTLKERINSMRGKRYLSPEEELEKRTLQKMKLMKKDTLSLLLATGARGNA